MLVIFIGKCRTNHEKDTKKMPFQLKQCCGTLIKGIPEKHIKTDDQHQHYAQP